MAAAAATKPAQLAHFNQQLLTNLTSGRGASLATALDFVHAVSSRFLAHEPNPTEKKPRLELTYDEAMGIGKLLQLTVILLEMAEAELLED